MRKNKYIPRLLLYIILGVLGSDCNAQILDFRIVHLKNIGDVPVPKRLDTLGQGLFKTVKLDAAKEFLDSIKLKNSFQISLAKLIESRFDTSVTIFLSTRVLYDILDSLLTTRSAEETAPETVLAPTIYIQKKKFKYHSTEMQKIIANSSNQGKITNRITSAYIDVMKNLLPQLVISDTSTSYFWYMKKFPVIKLKIIYSVKDYPNKSYIQNVFSIYKGYFNYYVRFEFAEDQEKEWKYFEKDFFDKLRLF